MSDEELSRLTVSEIKDLIKRLLEELDLRMMEIAGLD
jgi:hypothetical protein